MDGRAVVVLLVSPAALVFIGKLSGVRRSAQRRIVEALDGALAAAVVAEVDGSATDGLVDRVAAAVVGEVDGGARRARAGFAVVVVNVGRAPALPVARVCVTKGDEMTEWSELRSVSHKKKKKKKRSVSWQNLRDGSRALNRRGGSASGARDGSHGRTDEIPHVRDARGCPSGRRYAETRVAKRAAGRIAAEKYPARFPGKIKVRANGSGLGATWGTHRRVPAWSRLGPCLSVLECWTCESFASMRASV